MSESKQERWILAGDWAVGESQPIWADTGKVPLETVCLIPCDNEGRWKERRHLIQSAPELLEACERAAKFCEGLCDVNQKAPGRLHTIKHAAEYHVGSLRAAIASTKGER